MSEKDKKTSEAAQEAATPEQAADESARIKAECQEQLLRMRADFDNARKNLERDKQDAIRYANERLIAEILPIVDNFDRAMASIAEGHDLQKVRTGLELAQNEFHQVLERHGIQVIKCVGEAFDPRFHEAVATVESDELQEGQVADELQRGYLLNGRLLRPSRVRVATKK